MKVDHPKKGNEKNERTHAHTHQMHVHLNSISHPLKIAQLKHLFILINLNTSLCVLLFYWCFNILLIISLNNSCIFLDFDTNFNIHHNLNYIQYSSLERLHGKKQKKKQWREKNRNQNETMQSTSQLEITHIHRVDLKEFFRCTFIFKSLDLWMREREREWKRQKEEITNNSSIFKQHVHLSLLNFFIFTLFSLLLLNENCIQRTNQPTNIYAHI